MFASKQELSKHFSRNQVHGRGQRQLRVRTQRHSHGVSVFVVKAKSGVYTSSQSSSGNSSESEKNTYRRVLRYPDGYERVLIYPADYKGPSASTSSSFAQQQEINVGGEQPSQRSWDIAGLWNTKQQTQPKVIDNPTTRARSNSAEESDTSQDVEQVPSSIPNTPTELLRKQRSEEFLLASKLEWEYAKSSFEILHSSPWSNSEEESESERSLWILGTLGSDGNPQSFTLRTRIAMEGTENELEALMGKQIPIHVSRLTDGVITFESKGIADHFAEENSTSRTELFVFEVGSKELFQMTSEARAVVVLMKNTKSNPSLRMLSTVLRDQPKMES